MTQTEELQALQAEVKRLQEIAARNEAIVKSHQGNITQILPDGTVSYANRPEQISVGKPLFDSLPKIAHDVVRENLNHAFETGQIMVFENAGEGNDRYLNRVVPVMDGDQVASVVMVSYNIKHRIESERRLQESERMLRTVIDAIPVRVFWKDRELNYLGCNQAFAGDAGLESPEQIVGKTDYDMPWTEEAELFRTDDRQVIDSGDEKLNFEEPQTQSDGVTYWLQTSKIPLYDANDKIIGVLGTYEDITERKRAENELRAQQALLRQVIDSMPGMVFVKDWDGNFQLVNEIMASIYDVMPDDMIGKSAANFNTNAEEVQSFIEADRKVMESGETLLIPEEQVTSPLTGEKSWFQTTKIPLDLEEGGRQLLGVALDITKLKEAEQERERLQRQVIEAQRQALQELSTPIIPIMDQIIIMPLIGSVDSARARDIMRTMLAGISQHRAKIVILDVTGVPLVDSGVAEHLSRTMQAARLKGAATIVTGISDAVAETIVDLGIDWQQIETLRDLQSGLLLALKRLGRSLG